MIPPFRYSGSWPMGDYPVKPRRSQGKVPNSGLWAQETFWEGKIWGNKFPLKKPWEF